MFPTYCGAMGFIGWLVMLLVWTALVALVVWAVTRLFPDRPPAGGPADARSRPGEDEPAVPAESHRR